jgi:membrane-bound lytic murein transglycosylase D
LSAEEIFEEDLEHDMDDMLNLWYLKMENGVSGAVLSKLKDNTSYEMLSDEVLASRISKIITPIPLNYNLRVKRWIELYCEKRKRSSSLMLGLAQYYFPWMKEIFDRYRIPEELVYVTIIESALNPAAISHAGATGIWQFMYGTGKAYGLEVNTFIDDRRDPYKATEAAAHHLSDLYNIFHDWGLAISAYNCGAGNVRKAIARSGMNGKPDFWKIINYLPRETQNYFPAYIGALYLMNYHSLHGIEAVNIAIPSAVDTVMISKPLHLGQVAEVLSLNIEEVKLLNPQYKREVIPAYHDAYPLRLKFADLLRYIELADSIHAFQHDFFFQDMKVYEYIFTGIDDPGYTKQNIYHYVKKGETPTMIAKKYNLSISELKQMNNLKSNTLKLKQRLLVGYTMKKTDENPAPSTTAVNNTTTATVKPEGNSSTATAPKPATGTPDYYIVKKGDTLSIIAKRYGISLQRLADYNQIKDMNAISIGQKIKIPNSK